MLETEKAIPLDHGMRLGAPAIGSELAEGLLLMRANTMKMVRIHLAMERGDRALVLKAMDELVALDERIDRFLDKMPTGDERVEAIRREVEEQRTALTREKFSLAAGIRRSLAEATSEPYVESRPEHQSPQNEADETDYVWVEQADPVAEVPDPVQVYVARRPSRWRFIFATAAVLLVIALAAAVLAVVWFEFPLGQFLKNGGSL